MAIRAAVVQMMRDHTVIAADHRPSTLTAFDRILVINQGRIVEDVSIRALRQADGLFEQMWQPQAEGLEDTLEKDVT
ncbi:hypothetical protein [Methylobacterium sp. CM6257]